MSVKRYRKKPVVIEAMQYTVASCRALHDWLGLEHEPHDLDCDRGIFIDTLEGQMTATVGDWIIRGVKGEFYSCKPDIFEATYEPADVPYLDMRMLDLRDPETEAAFLKALREQGVPISDG